VHIQAREKGGDMHGHLSWLVELDVKDGQLQAAKTLMEEMVEQTSKEPTTHTYDFYISSDNAHVSIYEGYDSPESAHSHLKGFLEKFVGRFVEVFDATRMVVYGSPGDDLKADIADWHPIYMEHWGGFRR
jgi:quinol monooxygenase YgiN